MDEVAQGAVLSFFRLSKIKDAFLSIRHLRWKTYVKMVNPVNFSKPPSEGPELFSRINANVRSYSSNYAFVYVIFFFYFVLTNPYSLLPIGFVAALWYYSFYINPDVSIRGWQPNTLQKVAALSLLAFLVFFLSSASSLVFWVFGISTFVVLAHASCFSPAEDPMDAFDDQGPGLPITAPQQLSAAESAFPPEAALSKPVDLQ
eukprot:TRINITY_DN7587_c0_g1_i2.p1 TRINITY_DN7587_c0_g1~~TRINITY_DN7587_c0_g1_i2.p1  ORF type:complete len:203 (-),score=26.07 TRINITY_DN7587_c0_g1_i2:131-739(-)